MRNPLYLTFDDGPDPAWTPRVVDVLARHGATATFFVLGWRVREQPQLVAELLAAGHRVELHGDAHFDHEIATRDQLAADTDAALEALADCGVAPQWWRIPFGRPGPTTAELATEHGLRIVGWDADTHDWRGDRWAQQPTPVSDAAERGGVVLLHDAVVHGTPRTVAENTLELTTALLRHAARRRTPALAFPDASTPRRLPVDGGRSPFTRTEATRREWRARDAAQSGVPSAQPARGADGRRREPR